MALYDPAFELETQSVQRKFERFLVRCAIIFLCKGHERSKRYAVAAADEIHIVVCNGDTQDGEYAGRAARRRAEPEYIVVAPLDVDVRVLHQSIQKPRRLGAAVEDIADYVQLVDGKPLYDIRQRHDDLVGSAGRDDRLQQHLVIAHLV